MTDRTTRRQPLRRAGLIAGALLLGLGAWQIAQPAPSPLGDIAAAADTGLLAPTEPTEPPVPDPVVDVPSSLGFGAGDESPTEPPVTEPPAPTPSEPAEAARIVAAPTVADPTSVTIPALGVTAPVDRVALEPDGSMEIPHDIRRVGWYEPGVRPGETGSAVVAGHVDSRSQGRGALWGLKELATGNTVTVGHADGGSTTWQVTSRSSHVKEQLPIPELFTRFGDSQLVLITCGGSFDAARGRYTHNIVVIAEPVDVGL
jgi:hypothetical protein